MKAKPGFMLLELLIAITIFAGIMILALGAFARSATSAAKSNTVRARTEAARSVIDQISSDFRYIDIDHVPPGCPAAWQGKGFCLDSVAGYPNSLQMLLKYPDATAYVSKTYVVDTASTDSLVKVYERSSCDVIRAPGAAVGATCAAPGTTTSYRTMLPDAYVLELPGSLQIFTGAADTATTRGFVTVDLTIKPKSQADCRTPGCYKLKTTLVPGGI